MGAMMFGQKQPRRIHAAASYMRVHVNGASHDNMAGDVDFLINLSIVGLIDDAAILDPDVGDGVDIVNRVYDVAAAKPCSQNYLPTLGVV